MLVPPEYLRQSGEITEVEETVGLPHDNSLPLQTGLIEYSLLQNKLTCSQSQTPTRWRWISIISMRISSICKYLEGCQLRKYLIPVDCHLTGDFTIIIANNHHKMVL